MSKYADGRYHLDIAEMTSGTRVDGAYSNAAHNGCAWW